jgi:tRNA threonylcarbamoyladenosine biosynthesis protein TsaB
MKDLLVLGIETSGILCSVAWFRNECILLEYNIEVANIHATLLAKLVKNGFEELAVPSSELDLITIATGPGSFTGLRIGMSYAKGLSFGMQKPIKGVTNFEILAYSAPLHYKRLVTLVDARRNNYYMAVFSDSQREILEKKLVSRDDIDQYLSDDTVIVSNGNVSGIEERLFVGRYGAGLLCRIGLRRFVEKGADSLGDLEPLYMHPFAGVS